MLERSHEFEDVRAIRAALDPDDALADCRQHLLRRKSRTDACLEPQPFETGGRQHGRVAIAPVQLGETRVDIAAHHDDFEVRPAAAQLALAPRAGGADARAAGQVGE